MDSLAGVVERVTYFNPENGYSVLRLTVRGQLDPVTVVGNLPEITPGEHLRLEGAWTAHPDYGKQFKAEKCEQVLPATVEGIRRYLGSGLIKGIGPKTADKIVNTFGPETLYVIDSQPHRLREVPDIGQKRFQMITAAWEAQKAIKEVMVFLQGHGVSAGLAVKIYKQYGDDSLAVVKSDPYRLARDIWGIGFKTADKIARALGLPPDAPTRIEAGAAYALSEFADDGHVYAPEPELIKTASRLLDVSPDLLPSALDRLEADGRIRREILTGGDQPAVYLTPFYQAEVNAAARLKTLLGASDMFGRPASRLADFADADWESLFASVSSAPSVEKLSAEQRAAVQAALTPSGKVCVLTGGPGTGKCLKSDSLVLSRCGIKPIESHWGDENLQPDTFREHRIEVVSKDCLTHTSHIYFGGAQETIRIQTHLGLELEGTPNHRIWAMTAHGPDWLRLDQIAPDSYVAIRRGDDVWGQGSLAPDLAYVFGIISGDGSQSSASLLQIANGDLSLLQQCGEILGKHFGCRNTISRSRTTYNFRIYDTVFRDRLIEMGLAICKSGGKTAPQSVLHAPRASVVSYLAGLFDTDGHIQRRSSGQVSFEITLKSASLIRETQILLLNLGIVSRRSPKVIKYSYGGKTEERAYWRLSVFGKDVDLLMSIIPTRKAVEPQLRLLNTNRDVVPLPGKIIRDVFLLNGPRRRREWWAWKREIKGDRRPTRQRLLSLLAEVDPTTEMPQLAALTEASRACYFWDKVVATKRSLAQVYDLAVPDQESFIANGFVNHNTTVLKTLVNVLETSHHSYALASPTGRAAKRLAEATGRPAQTLHRLLGFSPTEGFTFNDQHRLPAHLVVVDEASMLDLILFNNLMKAVDPAAHLLLVGDVDQLPSVGAGDVLRDLVRCGRIPVVRLTQIFRQAADSHIITNAHRVNLGQMPLFDKDGRDFFLFAQADPDKAADWVVDVVQNRIPKKFKLNPLEDVQVLAPMHRGAVGVGNLNARLQAALNPPASGKAERQIGGRVFRVGDRVMQVRNNYQKDAFNGDIGRLAVIDLENQTLTVEFDGRPVFYDWIEADELQHAFAVSIHKAQGSEFPAVVVPMLTQHYLMLQRNLLYTAITRAKQLCVLVGTRKAIGIAVRNATVAQRWSGLAVRLA